MVTQLMIRPVDGAFDVAAVRAFVEALPHCARDAYEPHKYLIADSAEGLAWMQARRREDPKRFPYSGILVEVHATEIFIGCMTVETAPARALVAWLRARYALRYEDADYGGDITAYADDLAFLFGAS